LSCPDILGKFELWFHWGELRIVPKHMDKSGVTAGDLEVLDDWKVGKDGEITLIGKRGE